MLYKLVVLFKEGFIDGYFHSKKIAFESARALKQRLETRENPCLKILIFQREFRG